LRFGQGRLFKRNGKHGGNTFHRRGR
jgi:hypothetical protein